MKTLSQIAAEPKSDQLNASDLVVPRTITITKVTAGNAEQKLVVHFEGDDKKPYKPCKTMIRLMQHLWTIEDQKWAGQSMTVYNDPNVVFGGEKTGGVRISHATGITEEKKFTLRASKTKVAQYVVKPLSTHKTEPKQVPVQEADPALLEEGEENASRGVEAYTAWLAILTPEVKATIKHKHKDWTKLAKEADKPQPLETLE